MSEGDRKGEREMGWCDGGHIWHSNTHIHTIMIQSHHTQRAPHIYFRRIAVESTCRIIEISSCYLNMQQCWILYIFVCSPSTLCCHCHDNQGCMNIPSRETAALSTQFQRWESCGYKTHSPTSSASLPCLHPVRIRVVIEVETGDGSNQLITHKGKCLQSVEEKQSNTLFYTFVQALQPSCAWKLQ